MTPSLLPIGSVAPEFRFPMPEGQTYALSDFRNKKRFVLVFYPGDFTPICTAQLCVLRDSWNQLLEHDAFVLGINPANFSKHRLFAQRFAFPFPLVSDVGGKIAKAYGCRGWFGITIRTVYIVDKNGRIAFAARGNPPVDQLLQILHSLQDDLNASAHQNGVASIHPIEIPEK